MECARRLCEEAGGDRINPNLLQRGLELVGEPGVGSHHDELPTAQGSVFRVAEIPEHLDHPELVGTCGAIGEAHSSWCQFHDEEQLTDDQSAEWQLSG